MRAFVKTLFVVLLIQGNFAYAQQQLTPAQTAWLNAQTRKADEAFVKAVANIADVRRAVVEKARPAPGRITDPAERVITSLEITLGKPLSDEQKAAIRAADLQRQAAKSSAALDARKR